VEALAASSRAREALLRVVKDPPPGLALILLASIPQGSTAKFYRDLKRLARAVEFPEVSPNDVPGWVVDWASSRHGREITEEAARALSAGVGTNLGVLAQEVRKLTDLVPDGEVIGIEAVQAAGTRIPTEDRWVWMDRVGRREFGDALDGLGVLFAQGESGVGLTIGLATHLIRVALARTGGAGALESALPPNQKWLVPRLLQQAKGWTGEELEEALLGLRRVDRLLKSSSLSDDHVLEEWLLGMMAREGSAPT
jgi:DNA polymerase III delta subunit